MAFKLIDDAQVYQDDFDTIWQDTKKHEGGFTVDQGGPTNFGITQNTYNSYLKQKGMKPASVKTIPENMAKEIAKEEYYVKPKINQLPKNVARLVFDDGFNAGPGTAIQALQEVVGSKPDAKLGPMTIQALNDKIAAKGEKAVLKELVDKREQRYKDLIQKNPGRHKQSENGWMNRLNNIRKQFNLSMINPLAATNAEAAGIMDMEDDAGVFVDSPQMGVIGSLSDDLNLFDERPSFGEQAKKSAIEIAKGVGAGFEGIASGTGGLISILGQNLRIDDEKAKKMLDRKVATPEWIKNNNKVADYLDLWGKTAKGFWEKAIKQGVMAPDPELVTGTFRQNPSWTRGGVLIAQAVPSLGAAVAASAVAGPLAGLSYLSLLDSETIHAESMAKDNNLDKANALFAASTVVTGILEEPPFRFFTKGTSGKVIKDFLEGLGREGTQEFLQNSWQNIVRKIGIDHSQKIFEGGIESAIAGAGSGGVIGALSGQANARAKDVIKQAVEKGVTPSEIKAVDTMAQATILANADEFEKAIADLKPVQVKDAEGKTLKSDAGGQVLENAKGEVFIAKPKGETVTAIEVSPDGYVKIPENVITKIDEETGRNVKKGAERDQQHKELSDILQEGDVIERDVEITEYDEKSKTYVKKIKTDTGKVVIKNGRKIIEGKGTIHGGLESDTGSPFMLFEGYRVKRTKKAVSEVNALETKTGEFDNPVENERRNPENKPAYDTPKRRFNEQVKILEAFPTQEGRMNWLETMKDAEGQPLTEERKGRLLRQVKINAESVSEPIKKESNDIATSEVSEQGKAVENPKTYEEAQKIVDDLETKNASEDQINKAYEVRNNIGQAELEKSYSDIKSTIDEVRPDLSESIIKDVLKIDPTKESGQYFAGKNTENIINDRKELTKEIFKKVAEDYGQKNNVDIEAVLSSPLSGLTDKGKSELANKFMNEAKAIESKIQKHFKGVENGQTQETPQKEKELLKEPKFTVTKADLIPTRGPDGRIVWVAENVEKKIETVSFTDPNAPPVKQESIESLKDKRSELFKQGKFEDANVLTDKIKNLYEEQKKSTLKSVEEKPTDEKTEKAKTEEQVRERTEGGTTLDDGRIPDGSSQSEQTGKNINDKILASRGQESAENEVANYKITDTDQIGVGGLKTKFQQNLTAIKLLKKIESENRQATKEEKAQLVKYVGWGGMSQAFDTRNEQWSKEYEQLKKSLSNDEYESARASTINSHYTSPEIIKAMWSAVANMGFHKGNVLEPASGIGHFVGLAPQADKNFSLVELDSLTGRIAKLIYAKSNVQVKGLQEASLPSNYFGLAISNVPFSKYTPFDARAKALGIPEKLVLHDYFFAKALTNVKPGGLLAFITSSGTMDKYDTDFREYLNRKAKFIGALRLPSDAFKKNAGTEVVTDIIFLQKPLENERFTNPAFLKTKELNVGKGNILEVNEYFVDNPDKVIGKLSVGSGLYSGNEMIVKSGSDFQADLDAAIDALPKDIYTDSKESGKSQQPKEDTGKLKDNGYVVKEGTVYQKDGEELVKQDMSTTDVSKIKSLLEVRDSVRDLINAERTNLSDKEIETKRKKLNDVYDKFVKKYGAINEPNNFNLLSDDPDSPLLSSLEDPKKQKKGYTYKKREIFTQRLIKPHVMPTSAKNVNEALKISLAEYGNINWDYMSELLNEEAVNVQNNLIKEGLVFRDPEGDKLVLKDEYLSGNVKKKLKEAKEALAINPDFDKNVAALEKVIPADKTFEQIRVRLGMPWIRPETYTQFLRSLSLPGTVIFNKANGSWIVEKDKYGYYRGDAQQYGVAKLPGEKIVERIMNGKPLKIVDRVKAGDTVQSVVDEEQSALAEEKGEIIKEKFKQWLWEDDNRRETYEKVFNEEWNNSVEREYDGSHLIFPDMSPTGLPGPLRSTQLNAIWRGIITNRLMLAHSVGAGKTAIMTIQAMESKRLGLTNKTLIIAPKNTIPSWRNHINSLYPSAKALVASEKNFDSKKLKSFLSTVATGNWDIVVMSHNNFESLQVSPEAYQNYVQDQIDALREAKEDAKAQGSRITVKNIETAIKELEAKIESRLDQSKKIDILNFEELGIDGLYVDEADLFKNLAYTTMKQGIKGMGTQTGSTRAMDLKMKTDIIRQLNGKLVFATGTPISNSMVEVYSMMRYLQPEELKQQGIDSFDAWSNTFAEPSVEGEIDVANRYKLVTRFKNFMNMSALRTMIGKVWDIQTQQMLLDAGVLKRGVNLPNIKGGKVQNITFEQSPDLANYNASLLERAENIERRKGKVEKGDDIMLTVMMDGIKAALDMRMIDPTLKPNPDSKVEWTLKKIIEKHKEYNEILGTQLVFIDKPAPDDKAPFNPQVYMKKELIKAGIPANEIAFIHDYETDAQKEDLYEKMNEGKVRVLFGSTEKLGAGTNIQKRLAVEYHLGIPAAMRPRDITQREGRIDRPGNMNKEVEIYRLAQKGSLDTFIYQMLEAKSKTVEQFMRGDIKTLDLNEDDVNPYEAMKALSSDNPLIKEKADTDREVKRFKALYNAYLGERSKSSKTISRNPGAIKENQEELASYEAFKKDSPVKLTKDTFTVKVDGKEYSDKKEALASIYDELATLKGDGSLKKIGEYVGYPLYVKKNIVWDKVETNIGIKISDKTNSFLWGKASADPVGTFGSLDHGIFTDIDRYIDSLKSTIAKDEADLKYARELQSSKFEKQADMDKAIARQKQIEIELRKPDEQKNLKAVEQELGKSAVDNVDFMHAGIPLPQSVKRSVNDDIKGNFAFSDPEVESRFKAAQGVGTQKTIIQRIKNMFDEVSKRATRVYPTLPNNPRFAELRNVLNKQRFVRMNAQDRAIRAIDAILSGFGPNKKDLFTRKVILEDLMEEMKAGRALPFGYSDVDEEGKITYKDSALQADLNKIDNIIEANPDVKEALAKRKTLWEAINKELVDAGILKEEQLKENYFRHQVLEYARAKATFDTGKKLKSPNSGYSKKRRGSTFDINTDYLEAEFEVMSQALHDIETIKHIESIEKSELNIKPQLMEQAKEESALKSWRDLIPEGYTTWQPAEGNVFFMANSIPQRIVNEVLDGVEVGLEPEDIRKVLAVGKKRKEFVLPKEVAETLNNLYENKNPNFITEAAKKVTNFWKRWVLMNPRRFLKYNYQNFLGDFDAVVAGNPAILSKFAKANSELYDVFFKQKPITPDMREFVERGGISTQMTVQELPELAKMEIFLRLSNDPTANLKKQLNLWQRYWQSVGTLTTYREAIFRYAAFLHYKESLAKGGKLNYGASVKDEIDAISDPTDKAAKLATELLGDYANISALGKDMRETTIPFYSWMEINFKRYNQLFRNAFEEGWEKGIQTSATVAGMKGSFFLAKWALRASLLTAILALYNHLRYPDEEEELGEYDRNRVHINLGRDKNGQVRILRGQTAFSDILEWLGLNESPSLWREYFDGKTSLADIFGKIPGTDMPAFGLNPFDGKLGIHQATMKMVRAISPLWKLPAETLTGKALPVFDDRSWKIEDKVRNILKAFSLENEYDALMKEPTKGYKRSLQEALITTQDPEENAYRYIQGEKYKFLETVKGRGGSGDYYSPRSTLYRKYKKAIRYKDEDAKKRIEGDMRKMGISSKDVERSMKSTDPLFGLNKSDRREFVYHYLSQREREIYLRRANIYYRKTFLARSPATR